MVLTVAAAMKLVEIDRFADSLQTFTLLDRRITGFALFGVPVAECVPLMLCISGRARLANGVCFALLLFFTAVVAVHWLANTEPSCQCFGQWVSYRAAEHRFAAYFTRNGLIMVAAAAAAVAIGAPADRTKRRPSDGSLIDAI